MAVCVCFAMQTQMCIVLGLRAKRQHCRKRIPRNMFDSEFVYTYIHICKCVYAPTFDMLVSVAESAWFVVGEVARSRPEVKDVQHNTFIII